MTIENVKAFVDECVNNLVHCEYPYEVKTLRDKAFGVCDFATRFCNLDSAEIAKIYQEANNHFYQEVINRIAKG